MIDDGIVSVRQGKTGRGSALRVFVNILQMLCFADICLNKYSTLTPDQRKLPWCDHLREGVNASIHATQVKIAIKTLSDLNLDKEILDLVKRNCPDGQITLFVINKSTVATPTFGMGLGFSLTHIKDLVCKVKNCKTVKTQHALAKRTNKICLHNLLVLKSGHGETQQAKSHEVKSKMDHVKTVDLLLQQITDNFPSMNRESLRKFLPKNKNFLDYLR